MLKMQEGKVNRIEVHHSLHDEVPNRCEENGEEFYLSKSKSNTNCDRGRKEILGRSETGQNGTLISMAIKFNKDGLIYFNKFFDCLHLKKLFK
jgi:hypothetical protein